MATRRSFTFGSLVLALTGPSAARASAGAGAAAGAETKLPSLKIDLSARRRGGLLIVDLTVENQEHAPVEIVTQLGSRPGAWLTAAISLSGERLELAPVLEGDRREMLSRVGPIPQWAPLAAGKRLRMGPYKFAWPKGVPDHAVALHGSVSVERGQVEFERTLPLDASPPLVQQAS